MIKINNVTKSYELHDGSKYFVFKDLSFEFPENSNIGLIGPNGAGKSTLMNMLGGLIKPNSGSIETNNSISWPVGLTGGLQGSLSSRDNIRFVSMLYGLNKGQQNDVIDFVSDFADIGQYFDEPIKVLSSGMRSRIAFGLSMAFYFDYYLIDELFAVGDANFREKSEAIFQDKLKRSNIILVSHNMQEIKKRCDYVIYLNHGHVQIFNDVEKGIQTYQKGVQ